jgi:hypothetical protein
VGGLLVHHEALEVSFRQRVVAPGSFKPHFPAQPPGAFCNSFADFHLTFTYQRDYSADSTGSSGAVLLQAFGKFIPLKLNHQAG